MDGGMRLMYLANKGDLDAICEALDEGVDVNFRDIDNRTSLLLAACHGSSQVVELLLSRGAEVDPKDVWGSTTLADAIHYKNHHVIKKHGAKQLVTPMGVTHKKEVPEYEINRAEIDFSKSVDITKLWQGTFRMVRWRGIEVVVKQFKL